MPKSPMQNPVQPPVNPTALTCSQLARALGLPEEKVQRLLDEYPPRLAGGTINLVHFAAWLNLRLKDQDGD